MGTAVAQREGSDALQRPEQTTTISSSILPKKSDGVDGIRTEVSQGTRQKIHSAGEGMATGKFGTLQSSSTSSSTSKKVLAGCESTRSTKESLWSVQRAFHEAKTPSERPLSQDWTIAATPSQQLQLCNRLTRRIPETMSTSRPLFEKVESLACAIARTEGYWAKDSLPNRYHNPGDIRSRSRHAYEGQIGLNRSGYVIFRSDQFGWTALYEQIRKVLDNDSAYYNREMTFAEIAKIYASSPQWPKTLCKILKIRPRLTFDEYFGLAPRVLTTGVKHDTLMWLFQRRNPMPVLREMPTLLAQVR
jgi:hypothetical protein